MSNRNLKRTVNEIYLIMKYRELKSAFFSVIEDKEYLASRALEEIRIRDLKIKSKNELIIKLTDTLNEVCEACSELHSEFLGWQKLDMRGVSMAIDALETCANMQGELNSAYSEGYNHGKEGKKYAPRTYKPSDFESKELEQDISNKNKVIDFLSTKDSGEITYLE